MQVKLVVGVLSDHDITPVRLEATSVMRKLAGANKLSSTLSIRPNLPGQFQFKTFRLMTLPTFSVH